MKLNETISLSLDAQIKCSKRMFSIEVTQRNICWIVKLEPNLTKLFRSDRPNWRLMNAFEECFLLDTI